MNVMRHRDVPFISVIIPIYNTGPYLEDCISSVLNQSFSDFELILVNDGSTDNSKTICDRMCGEDGHIRLISYKDNKGVSYARNKGIDSAVGKYLFFLDSDDMIHPETLEAGLRQAEASGADMLMFERFFSDRNSMGEWEDFCSHPLIPEWHTLAGEELWIKWFRLMNRNCIGGKLFLREAVSDLRFVETVCCFEDGLFNYSFLEEKPRKVLYTNSSGYYYRIRGDSAWHNFQQDALLQMMEIRHGIMDREVKAGREGNAVLEEQFCLRLLRNWYAENQKNDKVDTKEIKKLAKEERNNPLFQKIPRRKKWYLFLGINFPSLHSALMSTKNRRSKNHESDVSQ